MTICIDTRSPLAAAKVCVLSPHAVPAAMVQVMPVVANAPPAWLSITVQATETVVAVEVQIMVDSVVGLSITMPAPSVLVCPEHVVAVTFGPVP